MTREEIDVLWQQAVTTSNINGDPAVRYEFANLVLEEAAKKVQSWSCTTGPSISEAIRSMKV